MRIILNGINGRYLREITDNAAGQTDYVEAAVAYPISQSWRPKLRHGSMTALTQSSKT